MGYLLTNKVKIDLGDLGTDNNNVPFFVEIRNPKLMTWEQKMELSKFGNVVGQVLTPEQTAERGIQMQDYAKSIITSWNLLDMNNPEQTVPINADDALKRVPSDVVERIFKEFAPKQEEATKNSSVQLDKPSEGDQLQKA